MNRHPKVLSQPGCRLPAAFALLAFALTPFTAASAAAEGREIALLVGEGGSDYERAGLSLRFGPMWSADWGSWKASLRPELELSHFRFTGAGPGPDSLNQFGGIGRLHLHYGEGRLRPYAEAGLGVSLFSRDTLGNKDFSTRFQFSQHLAVGVEFAQWGFAGLQYSHYSNADIEEPNDGIDLHQIVLGARF
ncbi:MAG TPA: acyloxyacyl hydrolase [Thiobacillus sp.]|jgi:opacity protein-like surface antigen|nr:acyloxyacyl hydrolase [Thiobacillus sp.]